MNDAFAFSVPIFRIAQVLVRIHLLTMIFMLGIILRANKQGYGWEALALMGILLITTLLHELGHSFAARYVEGDSDEILLWPLGGLAKVDIPHNPRAHLITALGGPMVDLGVCILLALILLATGYIAPFNFFWDVFQGPVRNLSLVEVKQTELPVWVMWLARAFWLAWISFGFNIMLVGYPMDMGRVLQSLLWPRYGFQQSTIFVCYMGYLCAALLLLFMYFFMTEQNLERLMWLGVIVLFIAFNCQQRKMQIEMGESEEGFMGYDFSQGYTSLEREEKTKKVSSVKSWMENRAEEKRKKEAEKRKEDAKRLDELLVKVKENGMESLTSEEQRFLKRVSARMRDEKE